MKLRAIALLSGVALGAISANAALSEIVFDTVVTTLDGSQGWSKTDVRTGGTADIVDLSGLGGNLEGNQPLSTGALKLTTDATTGAKAEIGYAANFGTASSILNENFSLSYSWFDTGGSDAAPSIKLSFLNAGYVGDGFGTLVYEPYTQGATSNSFVSPVKGDWVTTTIDLTHGRFWNTGMFNVGSSGGGSPYYTLAEWLGAFDINFANASLVGLSFGLGSNNPSETGYVDAVRIAGTNADKAWNFEAPATVPVPAGLPLLLAGLGALGLVSRRKKAPVAQV